MSDLGHAMFADNMASVEHYGDNMYTYGGDNGVDVTSLRDIIISKWQDCQTNGFSGGNNIFDDPYYNSLDPEDVYNSFDPSHIVDSAEGWDSEYLLAWFWDFIAEPMGIVAVMTCDGAIVWDEELIAKADLGDVA